MQGDAEEACGRNSEDQQTDEDADYQADADIGWVDDEPQPKEDECGPAAKTSIAATSPMRSQKAIQTMLRYGASTGFAGCTGLGADTGFSPMSVTRDSYLMILSAYCFGVRCQARR